MRTQGTPAELTGHPPEDAFMVPGMGYQPVPAGKYVAGNDNEADGPAYPSDKEWGRFINHPVCMPDFQEYPGAVDLEVAMETFGPLGGRRPVPPRSHWHDFEVTERDFKQPPADFQMDAKRGPFVQVYPASKFYPFDPRPEEVTLEGIAHGLSRICRYSGAPERHYSVAEHSVHMARYLACRGPVVDDVMIALVALFHDAPEALSGFNDVGRPVKDRAPIIGQTEANIYRLAIAPRFGLPLEIPAIVHEIDTRITADEVAAVMAPMDWHGMYDKPLGVRIRNWSPMKAKEEFIETYKALVRGVT